MQLLALLSKEFRQRMRGWRSLLIIVLYLGTLSAVGLGTIRSIRDNGGNSGLGAAAVGPQIFGALAEFQLILIVFITPALTAGAIAGERERQTFDLLLTTRLSSTAIVVGKLVTSLVYVLLLLFLSLPLFTMAFLFGGINPVQLGLTFVVLGEAALAVGSLSLFVSALLRRVQVATAVSYVLAFTLILGSGIFSNLLFSPTAGSTVSPFNAPPPPPVLAYFSPLAAISTIVTTPFGAAVSIPFLPLPTGLPDYFFNFSSYNTSTGIRNGPAGFLSGGYIPNFFSLPAVWPAFMLIYAVIIVVSLGLSVLFVRPPRFKVSHF